MVPQTLLLVLTSVFMSAVAQLLLKLGMSRKHTTDAIAGGDPFQTFLAIATSVEVISGLALYALGAVVWLFVLAKLDLSVAYPFVGLGFIVTMLFAVFVVGEEVSITRVAGTCLVIAGCILVARSA